MNESASDHESIVGCDVSHYQRYADMKNVHLILFALTAITVASCKDSLPPAPDNWGADLLANSSFQTSYPSQGYVDNSTFPPWDVAYGAPRFGAGPGADTIPGYAYLWGTSDDGTALYQPLTTPIQKGRTYRVTCKVKSSSSSKDFHNQKYVIVRFLAFNAMPVGPHWTPSPGQVAEVGKFTSTSLDTWDEHTTADWTADADYTNLEIDASTLASGSGNESWVAVDVVNLQEKQ